MFIKLNNILDETDYKVTDAEIEQAFQNLGYIKNTLNLEEFENAVIAGEITNFEPYFKEANHDELTRLREICIENDVYQEAYPEWASIDNGDEYDDENKFLLCQKGHCLDILIQSNIKELRQAVIEKDIKFALESHVMEYDQDIIHDELMEKTTPDKEVLDTYLECNDGSFDITALELKQKAMNTMPAAIEKTMSPTQLYLTHNPLWTLSFTGYDVQRIINSTAGVHELEKILENY